MFYREPCLNSHHIGAKVSAVPINCFNDKHS